MRCADLVPNNRRWWLCSKSSGLTLVLINHVPQQYVGETRYLLGWLHAARIRLVEHIDILQNRTQITQSSLTLASSLALATFCVMFDLCFGELAASGKHMEGLRDSKDSGLERRTAVSTTNSPNEACKLMKSQPVKH